MRYGHCSVCARERPLGELIDIGGSTLCEECAGNEVSRNPGATGSRIADPTVCTRCGMDNGSAELDLLAGLPFCRECTSLLRNRPFPDWIKIAVAVVVALAVISVWANRRYFEAYLMIGKANRAAEAGDFKTASERMGRAAELVPENENLPVEAKLYRAIGLLATDRAAEAVPLLREVCERFRGDRELQLYLLHAEAGSAFDSGDYRGFLDKTVEIRKADPEDPMGAAGVASAHACMYASTGDADAMSRSREWIAKARALAAERPAPQLDDYLMRIEHRLATREILGPREFEERYPEGWPANKEVSR